VTILHSTQPFPPGIDRDHFGIWLSGFTDGEGCFFLGVNPNGVPYAAFKIGLRNDDLAILLLIQSFLKCGRVSSDKMKKSGNNKKEHPGAVFAVASSEQLASAIIPQFEQYPLFAKKKRDFVIWKEGILLLEEVRKTPAVYRKQRSGKVSKWQKHKKEKFIAIMTALRVQREYNSAEITVAVPPPAPTIFFGTTLE
jgi:hypothetical protein